MPLPCPACGFLTLPPDHYGSYALCPLCDWEDDGLQLANPASAGGANRESLAEAQAQALVRSPLGSGEVRGFSRSRDWRPLTAIEIAAATAQREEKHWRNREIVEPDRAYWRRGLEP